MADADRELDPASTALVVVDAQNAFAHSDSPLAARGVDVSGAVDRVPALRELLATARDRGLTVAFTRSLRRADGRDAPGAIYDVVPDIYRDGEPICCAGDWDAGYVEGIDPRPEEYEVDKHRYDGFHDTRLAFSLRSEGVGTVVLAGFTTNVCVEGTARGAHERGFDVVVVEDCCGAFSAAMHDAAVRNVELILGDAVTREELRGRLGAAEA